MNGIYRYITRNANIVGEVWDFYQKIAGFVLGVAFVSLVVGAYLIAFVGGALGYLGGALLVLIAIGIVRGVVYHFSLSFRTIDAPYQGVLKLWGKPIRPVVKKGEPTGLPPGLTFVPLGIATLQIAPQTEILGEFRSPKKIITKDTKPGDIKPYENVDPLDMHFDEKTGTYIVRMIEPFQFKFASHEIGLETLINDDIAEARKKGEEFGLKEIEAARAKYARLFPENHPLNKDLTIDPTAIARIHIDDIVQFIQRKGSLAVAMRDIRSVTYRTLQNIAGHYTVAMMLYFKSEFEEELRIEIEKLIFDRDYIARLEKELAQPADQRTRPLEEIEADLKEAREKSWGVNLLGAHIETPGFSYEVNLAMTADVTAGFNAKAVVTASIGKKTELINVGIGTSEAIRLDLEAKAKGAAALADVAGTPEGRFAIEQRTRQEVAKEVDNFTSFGSGLDLMAAAAGVANAAAHGFKSDSEKKNAASKSKKDDAPPAVKPKDADKSDLKRKGNDPF